MRLRACGVKIDAAEIEGRQDKSRLKKGITRFMR